MNKTLVTQIREIASNHPEIESILLFGSRAHGDHSDLSDIDLAVKAPACSNLQWLLLAEQIEEEVDTLLKIDLVLYDQASEALQEQIDQCHEVLYEVQ